MIMQIRPGPQTGGHRLDISNSHSGGAQSGREGDVSMIAQSSVSCCGRVNCDNLSHRHLCAGASIGILMGVFCLALGLSLYNK